MVGDVRKHLQITPFVPFSIRTADGHEYPVTTVDHVKLPLTGGRVVISDSEGVVVVLPGLLLTGPVADVAQPANSFIASSGGLAGDHSHW